MMNPTISIASDRSPIENRLAVALLTGGSDRPYVFGLAPALVAQGANLDLIAGEDLECPEFHGKPGLNFMKFRSDQSPNASILRKTSRVLSYYAKLIRYAATARPKIFHILWNNRFEFFDRTLLMLYYKLLRKMIVLTAHNVNGRKRDSTDTLLNRITLRIQYRLCDHIFVHTEKMKDELLRDFRVDGRKVTVIPFGINNTIPNTQLTPAEAKLRLGIPEGKKAILFFGRIAPYKGLEYLVTAFKKLLNNCDDYMLIIAGRPDNCAQYWGPLREAIQKDLQMGRILLKAEFIPDEVTEVYFKAADVLVLPYKDIFQSGVLFTGHNFGLPTIVADVGSLHENVIEGETGFVFTPGDAAGLAATIERYFASDLYADLDRRRGIIHDHCMHRHSWVIVGQITLNVYAGLLRMPNYAGWADRQTSGASLDVKSPL